MNRRELITGLVTLVAAPAIVRAGSLMPVKVMLPHQLERIVFYTMQTQPGDVLVERMRITADNKILFNFSMIDGVEIIGSLMRKE